MKHVLLPQSQTCYSDDTHAVYSYEPADRPMIMCNVGAGEGLSLKCNGHVNVMVIFHNCYLAQLDSTPRSKQAVEECGRVSETSDTRIKPCIHRHHIIASRLLTLHFISWSGPCELSSCLKWRTVVWSWCSVWMLLSSVSSSLNSLLPPAVLLLMSVHPFFAGNRPLSHFTHWTPARELIAFVHGGSESTFTCQLHYFPQVIRWLEWEWTE